MARVDCCASVCSRIVEESFGSTFRIKWCVRLPQSTNAKVDAMYSRDEANRASTYGMGGELPLTVPTNQQSDEVQEGGLTREEPNSDIVLFEYSHVFTQVLWNSQSPCCL